jgi:hypothetical protein
MAKHTHKTENRVTRASLISVVNSGARHVNLVTNLAISNE